MTCPSYQNKWATGNYEFLSISVSLWAPISVSKVSASPPNNAHTQLSAYSFVRLFRINYYNGGFFDGVNEVETIVIFYYGADTLAHILPLKR